MLKAACDLRAGQPQPAAQVEGGSLRFPGKGRLQDTLLICWGRLLPEGRERTGQLGPARRWLAPPEMNTLQQTGEQALAKPEARRAEVPFVLFVLWKKEMRK